MKNKIRILFLLDFFPFPENRDGLTKILANIINRLDDSFEITLLIVNCEKHERSKVSNSNIKILEKSINRSRFQRRINQITFLPQSVLSLKSIKELDKEFNFNHFQIIHTALHSFVNVSKIHKHVIYGINDSLSITCINGTFKGSLKYYYHRILEYRLSKMNHTITTVSEFDAKAYYQNDSLVLPIGVNTEEYYPINQETKIKDFVFHGVLDYQVNIDSIKYISDTLNEASSDYSLHIIGRINGGNKPGLIEMYSNLTNCKYIGEVEHIPSEITKYQFYISLMNSGAGIKNKILEAMSCGMIVIVNERAIEGFSNQVELSKCIFLIKKPSDINKVVNNIDQDWEVKRNNAIEFVKKYYSWSSYMKILIDRYKRMI